MSIGSVDHVGDDKKELVKEVYSLDLLEESSKGGLIVCLIFESSLLVDVISKKYLDPLLIKFNESVLKKNNESLSQR